MKKLFALILIVLLCVGIAGCSSNEPENDAATVDSETLASSSPSEYYADPSYSIVTESSDTVYDSISEYLEDEKVKSEVSSFIDGAGNDVYSDIKVYADGDLLVYDYTYSNVYDDEQIPKIKDNIDTASDDAFGFSDILDDLKTHVNIENPQIEVIYRNGDGTVITSRTFG